MIALEVCVDTLEGVRAAKAGGATRVELCSALSEGGLTPSVGLMRAAAGAGIPCFAMIRPRAGLFHFGATEVEVMCHDIYAAREAGLAGVVLGAQGADGRLTRDVLERLSEAAEGMGRTLHRVIDVVPDPFEALELAVALGFERVLTSGGAATAPEGAAVIAEMVRLAEGRISVMPGAGLTPENVAGMVARTGVRDVHASCSVAVAEEGHALDFAPASGLRRTDEATVRRMVSALAR